MDSKLFNIIERFEFFSKGNISLLHLIDNRVRGRKKQYGEKIKLKKIFEKRSDDFSKAQCFVYEHMEIIKILCLDLLWKPTREGYAGR